MHVVIPCLPQLSALHILGSWPSEDHHKEILSGTASLLSRMQRPKLVDLGIGEKCYIRWYEYLRLDDENPFVQRRRRPSAATTTDDASSSSDAASDSGSESSSSEDEPEVVVEDHSDSDSDDDDNDNDAASSSSAPILLPPSSPAAAAAPPSKVKVNGTSRRKAPASADRLYERDEDDPARREFAMYEFKEYDFVRASVRIFDVRDGELVLHGHLPKSY